LGLRQTSVAPHRGQYPGLSALAGRESSSHVRHETSPASAALGPAAFIGTSFPRTLESSVVHRKPPGLRWS
jgi:hypothetical protein